LSDTTSQPGPAAPPRSDLASRARTSSIATLVGHGSANLLRLGSNILLSYLLFPEDFGTMALVLTFLVGLQMFSDVGVGAAIVRSPRGDDPRFLDTAFTVQAIRGVLLWLAALVLAPGFAWFYKNPALADYLPVAAFQAVLAGLYSTRIFAAERSLAIVRKVACDVAAQALAIGVMLALAYLWRNVWALVIGGLVQPLAVMVLSHTVRVAQHHDGERRSAS
jgi:O-antigen/teichoic acid export membrane protein